MPSGEGRIGRKLPEEQRHIAAFKESPRATCFCRLHHPAFGLSSKPSSKEWGDALARKVARSNQLPGGTSSSETPCPRPRDDLVQHELSGEEPTAESPVRTGLLPAVSMGDLRNNCLSSSGCSCRLSVLPGSSPFPAPVLSCSPILQLDSLSLAH